MWISTHFNSGSFNVEAWERILLLDGCMEVGPTQVEGQAWVMAWVRVDVFFFFFYSGRFRFCCLAAAARTDFYHCTPADPSYVRWCTHESWEMTVKKKRKKWSLLSLSHKRKLFQLRSTPLHKNHPTVHCPRHERGVLSPHLGGGVGWNYIWKELLLDSPALGHWLHVWANVL